MNNIKCEISWIDSLGNPTPDNNDAIAMAVCYDPMSFGEKGSEPIPICEKHAKIKGKFWKLQSIPQHDLVRVDELYFKIIPNIVSNAIKNRFSDDYSLILDSLQCHGNYWAFIRGGIYYGVESIDGHIHT